MRCAIFFLATLAWGQEAATTSGKLSTAPDSASEGVAVPRPTSPAGYREQCSDQKQEIQRLTTLLNWYQQQFFALQARQIEQQVAPKEQTKSKEGTSK